MASNGTSKRTTLADLMAAAALGAIDPTTEVVTGAEATAEADEARAEATSEVLEAAALRPAAQWGGAPVLTISGTEHDCAIPGCRHGAAHGPSQPDRQLKLEAPCGAVARMTARALRVAGGAIVCAHGDPFAEATRRPYVRKA